MTAIGNLPKKEGPPVVGEYEPEQDRVTIMAGLYVIDSFTAAATSSGASHIAYLMQLARDQGYRQAQQDMRRQLGLED